MGKRKLGKAVEKARAARRRKRRIREQAIGFAKDVTVAFIIVLIVMGSLYAYSGGIWPPMVVVESESMMHGTDSKIGVIDTGDLTLVKKIASRHDVVTYVEGRGTYTVQYTEYLGTGANTATGTFHGSKAGYQAYGDYGDVIIYRKNGMTDDTPIIHRAMVWFVPNTTADCKNRLPMTWGGAGDYPDIKDATHPNGLNCVGDLTIKDVGYTHEDLSISSAELLAHENSIGLDPYAGILTKGDGNRGGHVDQNTHSDKNGRRLAPNQVKWVVGKAVGELPWFGALKLVASNHSYTSRVPPSSWRGLFITIALIIIVPFLVDIAIAQYSKRKAKKAGKKGKEEEDDEDEDKEEEEKDDDQEDEKEKKDDALIEDVKMDDDYSKEFEEMAASKSDKPSKNKKS
jgi:signal peptidase